MIEDRNRVIWVWSIRGRGGGKSKLRAKMASARPRLPGALTESCVEKCSVIQRSFGGQSSLSLQN